MNTQGIGLGLVISENIVKAFGGTIGVQSKFQIGSIFAFSMVLGSDTDQLDILNENAQLVQAPSMRSIPSESVQTSKEGSKPQNDQSQSNEYQKNLDSDR